MAGSSTSLSASSSSSTHQWTRDVFLSFRGDDTRYGFTYFLHQRLCDRGINSFMDLQLRKGDQISSALLQEIVDSRFSIIIFSRTYASSSWCLDELTKILDCVKEKGHTAIPVFYEVDPSDVQEITGSYADAFEKHKQVYGDRSDKVLRWRNALTEVSNMSGYDARHRYHYDVIDEIVWLIRVRLYGSSVWIPGRLVGMNSRIDDLEWNTHMNSHMGDLDWGTRPPDINLGCKIIGIWGMAGIGKSTIAFAWYNQLCYNFKDGGCVLEKVGEKWRTHGITSLKEELYSKIFKNKYPEENFSFGINLMAKGLKSRTVLIVLDDVDHVDQIKELGDRGSYAKGSRIIITTRNRALLLNDSVDFMFEHKRLNDEETFELFCWHAFKGSPPPDHYRILLMDFFEYMNGLPLAVRVLGSYLNGKPLKLWEAALENLKKTPHQEIMKVLRTSYDRLDFHQQQLFLDIACFYEGQDKNLVARILEGREFDDAIIIRDLIDLCLIFESNSKLCMHNLLQEMGWEIVRLESVKFPGERSRLWFHEEVNDVLTTHGGSRNVEGMVLDLSALNELRLEANAFENMSLLKVLRFCNAKMDGCLEYLSKAELFGSSYDGWKWRVDQMLTADKVMSNCTLHLEGDFIFPSVKLRSLCWHGCPIKSLPKNFYSTVLIELNLCSSLLEQLWEGNQPLKNLRIVKLSHSKYLTRTPDFSGAPNIRRLILEGCTSLVEVHPSIGALKELIFLNFEGCENLKYISSISHMKSLEILILSGCSKLKQFPEIPEKCERLRCLFLDETALSELPSSIGNLNGLVWLNLTNCKKLLCLPQRICELMSLKILTVAGCSKLKKLPDELGCLQSLEELNADGSGIQVAPPSCALLTKLQVLPLAECLQLHSLFNVVFSLWSSPTRCVALNFLSNLSCLKTLMLSDCNLLEDGLPEDLSLLSSLERLDLSKNDFSTVPTCLCGLSQLKRLFLMHCSKLQSVGEEELPLSIEEVWADHCSSLETFSFPRSAFELNSMGHFIFTFSGCFKLVENERSDAVVGDIVQAIKAAALDYSCLRNSFQAIVPGNSIPEWFVYQSVGSSVTVQLPTRDWYNKALMGLAACVVFNVDATLNLCYLHVSVYFGMTRFSDNVFSTLVQMEGDLVWFGYQSLARLEESGWPDSHFSSFFHPMSVSFSLGHCSSYLVGVVKKCGFRLVYVKGGRVCDGDYAKVPDIFYRHWNPIHEEVGKDIIASESGSP